jgi:hypothetical protein
MAGPETVVRCLLVLKGQKTVFSQETLSEHDLTGAKPVEVTRDHPEGPLKELLSQLESVQTQSNHFLSQLIQEQTVNQRPTGELS